MTPARDDSRRAKIVAYSDAPEVGGAEHALATLLGNLDERFSVDVIATDPAVGELLEKARPDSTLKLLPPVDSRRELRAFARHVAAIRSSRPDIVHVNRTWIWAGQVGILAALPTPRARILTVEHSQPVPAKNRTQRVIRSRLAKRLDAVVAVGDHTARTIESNMGLPAGRVRTIHNGIPTVPPCPRPSGEGPPTVGAIGRISFEKGYDNLCRMLRLAPALRLVLIGDGPDRDAVADLARELGVEDRLQMLGWQSDPNRWFPQLDVLAVPSRAEGAPPLVALEAMMAGVPVVATDVGSISDAVEDGRTGVLVPPEDPATLAAAVTALAADPERQRLLSQSARELVLKRFTIERMVERFEALYDELLGP